MPAVAINGLGRIGRAALKILLDTDEPGVAAVNDIADAGNEWGFTHQMVREVRSIPGMPT